MTTATTIDVRLDQPGTDRLEQAIGELQLNDPKLTVDDCIDVIFSIGLISVYSTLSVVKAIKESA